MPAGMAAGLAVGGLVGFISGLTGIGGGVLMVPFLYALYARFGVAQGSATVLAHATSLAVIAPTAARGLLAYRGKGLIEWRAAVPIGVVGGLSAAITAQLVPYLPSSLLRTGFGIFLLVVSTDLMLRRGAPGVATRPGRHTIAIAALLGVPVGAIAGALGIGGGVPATLARLYFLGIDFAKVVPTSLAFILFTSLAGSASYALVEAPPMPFGWVVGHVDLGHALPLAVGAVACAPLGVALNRRLPVFTLRRVLGVVIFAIGLDLIWTNT